MVNKTISESIILRKSLPSDSPKIISLIDGIYRHYGDRLLPDSTDNDLLNIDNYYRANGGEFMVLEYDGRLVGTRAVLPDPKRPGVCFFRRLYVDQTLWGQGLGNKLMSWAIDWAVDHKMIRIEFWSDVRFERAHSFFKKWGFTKGEKRSMNDGWMPYEEYFFSRNL